MAQVQSLESALQKTKIDYCKLFSDFHVLTSATQHPINKIYLKKFLMLLKENKVLKTNTNISPLSSKFSMLPVKRKAINILQTITEII